MAGRDREVGKTSPLDADDVVVIVPKGLRDRLVIEELDEGEASAQITVRVSRDRPSSTVPTLGIIVK